MINNIFVSVLLLLISITLSSQSSVDATRQKIDKIYQDSDLTGLVVSVVNADGILYSEGFGYADIENTTPYRADHIQIVASVSKTWIGVALMQCVEQGLFNLDTDINELLPFEVVNPNYPNKPITIRQLATHTSSIIYPIPDYHKVIFEDEPNLKSFRWSERRAIKAVLNYPAITMTDYLQTYLSPAGNNYSSKYFGDYMPGEKYQYSNAATALAAYLVELVSKQSFEAFCQQNITEPLGLTNAGFNISNRDMSKAGVQYFGKKQTPIPLYSHRFYPTGGLRISNDDLNLFLIEIIKGYQGQGTLLSEESYLQLLEPQFKAGQLPANFDENETNHGIFWTYRNDLIGHTGGGLGATCFMFFDKNTGIGKIFTVNCELEGDKKLIATFLEIWQVMSEVE